MKKNMLILGAKGMLAQDLAKVFQREKTVLWDREDLDITDEKMLMEKIGNLKPKIIINSAAFTDVDKAEEEKELAFKINSAAVGYLVEIAKKIGATLFHFSTDYVFDGNKKDGYREDDIPQNPLSVYGQSKLGGERRIFQEEGLKYYLVRTSWLFGPSTENRFQYKNFVNTILNLVREKDVVKIVDDQFGKPAYTLDVAKGVKGLVEKKSAFGIYHLVNEPSTNWYNFTEKIIEIAGLKTKVIPCKTEEFLRPAKRPKYSILLNTRFPKLRNWEEALRDYLRI